MIRLQSLGSRERRMVVVGVVSISGIVSIGKGLPALRDWEDRERASAEEAIAELNTIQQTLATGSRVRARAKRVQDELEARDASLLHGASPAEAAGALALLVNRYADSAAVRLGAVSVRSDSNFVRGFAVATVRAGATGDVEGLMTLLQLIEDGGTKLSVRELTVTQPDPAAPDSKPEELRFEVVVRALVRKAAVSGVKS